MYITYVLFDDSKSLLQLFLLQCGEPRPSRESVNNVSGFSRRLPESEHVDHQVVEDEAEEIVLVRPEGLSVGL